MNRGAGPGEAVERFLENTEGLPDGWPLQFEHRAFGCDHFYHWDISGGHYRCLRCGYTLDEPTQRLLRGDGE